MKSLYNNSIDDLYGFSDITDLSSVFGDGCDTCNKIYYGDPKDGCISGWEPSPDVKQGQCNGNGGYNLGRPIPSAASSSNQGGYTGITIGGGK